MNWEATAAIGQVIGASAVVATVIYLAKQIRENVRYLRITSINDTWSVISDAFAPIYNSEKTMEIWVVGMKTPDLLSDQDREIFVLLATRLMSAFDNVLELHALGVVADERYESYMRFARYFHEAPGGKFWRETSGLELSTAMRAALQKM